MKFNLKYPWYYYLLGFSLVAIIAASILRALTPETATVIQSDFVTTNISQTATEFSDITLSPNFVPPDFPKTLSFYKVEPTQNSSSKSIEEKFKNIFDLKPENQENSWSGEQYYLSYIQQTNEYLLSNKELFTTKSALTQNQAVNTCQPLIDKIYDSNNLKIAPYLPATTYFTGQIELEEATPIDATWVEVPFTFVLEGLPTFIQGEDRFPITCLVNSDQQVHQLYLKSIPYQLSLIKKSQIFTLSQALENVNRYNLGAIIYANSFEFGPLNLDQINQGLITDAQLEYRIDLDLNIAYPFYHFKGTLTNASGKEIEAEIITPAVATKQIE